MRRCLQAAAAAALFCLGASAAVAAPRTECQPQALRDLQRLAPEGYAVYTAVPEKKHFMFFLACDNVQLGLATAVHESVHMITEHKDGYPLINGEVVKRVHEASRFYPPREIARKFDGSDPYVQTYLRRGAASSADDFVYLLDEMNAYSHDLNTATKVASLNKSDARADHRAGLAALMSFVMSYVDGARQDKAQTWQGLQKPQVKQVVLTLWGQAETVLAKSMGVSGMGGEKYVRVLCDRGNGAGLRELLGKAHMSAAVCGPGGPAPETGSVR
jgi:hypothetical protein